MIARPAGENQRGTVRACLHGCGEPEVGEVTCLGGVKNNSPLHAILQPRHPGVHSLKIIEWSLSTSTKKNAGKPRVLAINALLHSLVALAATFSAMAFYC